MQTEKPYKAYIFGTAIEVRDAKERCILRPTLLRMDRAYITYMSELMKHVADLMNKIDMDFDEQKYARMGMTPVVPKAEVTVGVFIKAEEKEEEAEEPEVEQPRRRGRPKRK